MTYGPRCLGDQQRDYHSPQYYSPSPDLKNHRIKKLKVTRTLFRSDLSRKFKFPDSRKK